MYCGNLFLFVDFLARSQGNLHFDRVNVDQRQQSINNSYKELIRLGQVLDNC